MPEEIKKYRNLIWTLFLGWEGNVSEFNVSDEAEKEIKPMEDFIESIIGRRDIGDEMSLEDLKKEMRGNENENENLGYGS